jgi:hypothetical protein
MAWIFKTCNALHYHFTSCCKSGEPSMTMVVHGIYFIHSSRYKDDF